jgi:4-aminobutyrate aminotransferase
MIAAEFRTPNDPLTLEGLPEGTAVPKNIGRRLLDYCYNRGLLLLTTSSFDTIRFIPALIVTKEEMDEAIEIFAEAVHTVAREG